MNIIPLANIENKNENDEFLPEAEIVNEQHTIISKLERIKIYLKSFKPVFYIGIFLFFVSLIYLFVRSFLT